MRQAIQVAIKGQGAVEPNPMVGCVITKHGDLIGAGYHERFGGPHAEVNAIENCVETTEGATAYVTLEPCAHTGKTPPCAHSLVSAGIQRVVVGTLDPFERVSGKGIEILQAAGIECKIGVLEAQCREFNAPYFQTRGDGAAVDHWQMGDDIGRQDCYPDWRQSMDIKHSVPGHRSPIERSRRRGDGRHRDGTGR